MELWSTARRVIMVMVAGAAFVGGYAYRGTTVGEGEPAAPLPDETSSKRVVDEFHKLYYNSQGHTWTNTYWRGARALKLPLDLWVFQEIIYETKPDVIVETGTYQGGSALYMATVLDTIGKGRLITIDIEDFPGKPRHERITYLIGSSTSDAIVNKVKSLIGDGETVMAVLDSDHRAEHVLNELRIYGEMVTTGNYLVAEDTNINGRPVLSDFGPGPWEAVQSFLQNNSNYAVDVEREKFLLTFNSGGYLIRIR